MKKETNMPTHPPKKAVVHKTLLASLICAIAGAPAFAQEAPQGDISELAPITVTAAPLNKAFEVNVGGFGARDTMEVPLARKASVVR